MMFDVSVIVPIYNVANYIEKCLVSLFSQTHNSIEFVFVNDCTSDNSIDILYQVLDRFPERKSAVKLVQHEKNKGLAAARITGISNASGEYIQHVDSDDFIDVNMVECLIKNARANNSDIVISDIWIEWLHKRKKAPQRFISKEQYLVDILEGRIMPGVVNKLARKKIYVDYDIFPIEGMDVGEDLIVTPRLIYYADIITKVDDAFYYYVQYNPESYTKQFKIKALQNVSYVLDFLKTFFSNSFDNKYLEALEVGISKKKVQYLKEAGSKNTETVLSYFSLPYNKNFSSKFNLLEKFILNLSEHNLILLKINLCIYRKMFSALQSIKRRN
ncbi:glycosyltransferase family 2 protein [Chryseobacterium sp. PMSZPI]|uniref:glycosyltransferase family 2 protein n=1 Tax=Chryseobacterium sp. PMSZPI TaxID=1033900 RepID=UPI000C32446C|nr:glycosyltransferase family 2 protein [Chryseobacterium sp. PMSZPI]PKF74304.1 glycosyl transferase [Chryseobacterium sp. PMSZPI]